MNIEVNKVKIFVTIPTEKTNEIREIICKTGKAGKIGKYSYCTTCTKVVGTFVPNDKSSPYIGKKNEMEFVTEDKLEIICDIKNAKEITKKIREIHPYEEPDINIIPLIDENSL